MDKVLSLKNLAHIEPFSAHFARLGDLYILSHIVLNEETKSAGNQESGMHGFNVPLRLNGMLFFLVDDGMIRLQVNTETYDAETDDLLVVRPGTLINFSSVEFPTEITLLFLSSTFLNTIDIDLNNIEFRSILSRPRNVMKLAQNDSQIIRKYFDLLMINAQKDSVLASRTARTLMQALVYEIFSIALLKQKSQSEDSIASGAENPGRAQNYVFRFIQMLHVHYAHQRNIDFYAKQLCITPKYLSMITKELTGNTASEWLNRIVILEAKNMLRFSDKNIQEVAYALNFPSQSAFGKYFKRMTGLSPSEYLKSPNY